MMEFQQLSLLSAIISDDKKSTVHLVLPTGVTIFYGVYRFYILINEYDKHKMYFLTLCTN